MTDAELSRKVFELGEAQLTPTSHLFAQFGPVKIIEASQQHAAGYTKLSRSRPAVRLIEVVLAANRNYNKVVKPNIDRISRETDLQTFHQLVELIRSKSAPEFYEFWGHRDAKKYQVLTEILNRLPELRRRYPAAPDDFHLLNSWAVDVDLAHYKEDIIGEIKFVAIATTQHLRMCFGCNTVKPDQRVKEVLQRVLGYPPMSNTKVVQAVEHLSAITGLSALVVDQIFVNYGSGYFNRDSR